MVLFKESAPAKVNLTLKVLGKRTDGYHELMSLVVFADEGDRLELVPGEKISLTLEGPFAAALEGEDNLVLKTVHLLAEHCPSMCAGAFKLDKRLPVAAGLGGGSADAAAALRLLVKANPGQITAKIISGAARRLGADVTACLDSGAVFMQGRGDELRPVKKLPALPAVLVNPGLQLGAGDVYEALGAKPLEKTSAADTIDRSPVTSVADLVHYIRETGNDLEAAATKLAPAIAEVRAALSATEGCLVAQMSGSGPTCFGLFSRGETAGAAARTLAESHPDWWVLATELG